MKKILLSVIISALILSACKVGPKEQPEQPLVSGDAAVTEAPATLPPETPTMPATVTEPATEPVTTQTEPASEPTTEPEETTVSQTVDAGEIELSDEYNGTIMYATMSLNIRTGPSTDYDVIGYLAEGQEVEIIGYAEEYGWYAIDYFGTVGFVSGGYMTETPPVTEYTALDIDEDHVMELLKAYAEAEWINEIDIENYGINGYYGAYDVGEVISVDANGTVPDASSKVGDYTFDHLNNTSSLWLITQSGEVLRFNDYLYSSGLLSDEDLEQIYYYYTSEGSNVSVWGERHEYPGYDDPEPLSADAEFKILSDFAASMGVTPEDVYILNYYGTYSGGEAVVMWWYDTSTGERIGRPVTDDIKEFRVAGYSFLLTSGSYDLVIHTASGEFIEISDAYAAGLLTEEEVEEISYHNFGKIYE